MAKRPSGPWCSARVASRQVAQGDVRQAVRGSVQVGVRLNVQVGVRLNVQVDGGEGLAVPLEMRVEVQRAATTARHCLAAPQPPEVSMGRDHGRGRSPGRLAAAGLSPERQVSRRGGDGLSWVALKHVMSTAPQEQAVQLPGRVP